MCNTIILQGVFSTLAQRFNEGGPLFMSLILFSFIASIVFLTIGFMNVKKHEKKSIKMAGLASDSSLLGLVLGLLGTTIGLISAFDAIESLQNVNQAMMAGGLKVSALTTAFGAITFVLSRIGIIVLRAMQKA